MTLHRVSPAGFGLPATRAMTLAPRVSRPIR